MGQFEYSLDISLVKPEDIERVAKDFLIKKRESENSETNSTRGQGGRKTN
jgi:hypothetical protein